MFIETHVIQNFAPSCLNRDDTNTPKDCIFGGVRRARISSQCIKRAIRHEDIFKNTLDTNLANRTRWQISKLEEIVESKSKDKKIATTLGNFISSLIKSSNDEKEGKEKEKEYQKCAATSWLTEEDLNSLINFIDANFDAISKAKKKADKEKFTKEFLNSYEKFPQTPDIALFGRMLANAQKMNIDAACQVAHAISTHKVEQEMDFFTAVDDLQEDGETGADMMGVVEFNSACFYRYAVIHWKKLLKNLGGDQELAMNTVEAFLRALPEAIPTGKQNTFAAHNPPSFVYAVVRDSGAPWSLANAFESPVRANGSGLAKHSIEALDSYWGKLSAMYGAEPTASAFCSLEEIEPANLQGKVDNFNELVARVKGALS
ncbi:MAG: type I-E CRISPR-associated protein Cas7/Cse4/CasC [Candidatus Hinthialibacter antarcticus]|nr:type I-E CRISPR-associated protein Cas7/Cse4/CasC [Candidatus Hinthialibacter antarcticus]